MRRVLLVTFSVIVVLISTGISLAQQYKQCSFKTTYETYEPYTMKPTNTEFSCFRDGRYDGYCFLHAKNHRWNDFDKAAFSEDCYRQVPMIGVNIRGIVLPNLNLRAPFWAQSDFSEGKFQNMIAGTKILNDCKFVKTDLSMASFFHCVLYRCDFSEAKLEGADFRGAWLQNSSFKKADLTTTNLNEALLEGVDFSGAFFNHTFFDVEQLKKAKGLETINWGDYSVGFENLRSYDKAVKAYDALIAIYTELGKTDYVDKFKDRLEFAKMELNPISKPDKTNKTLLLVISLGVVAAIAILVLFVVGRKRSKIV